MMTTRPAHPMSPRRAQRGSVATSVVVATLIVAVISAVLLTTLPAPPQITSDHILVALVSIAVIAVLAYLFDRN